MRQKLLSTLGLAWISMALAACATSPTAAPPAAKFTTPPNWLDRVSVVAYLPKVDYDAPPALGDYQNEPARFYFQGHPLNAAADQGQDADQGAADATADQGGGDEE